MIDARARRAFPREFQAGQLAAESHRRELALARNLISRRELGRLSALHLSQENQGRADRYEISVLSVLVALHCIACSRGFGRWLRHQIAEDAAPWAAASAAGAAEEDLLEERSMELQQVVTTRPN